MGGRGEGKDRGRGEEERKGSKGKRGDISCTPAHSGFSMESSSTLDPLEKPLSESSIPSLIDDRTVSSVCKRLCLTTHPNTPVPLGSTLTREGPEKRTLEAYCASFDSIFYLG